MRAVVIVVRGVLGEHLAQVTFTEDQHAVGELGADRQDEAFGVAVRSWAAGWDLDHGDAGAGEDGVERGGELSGAVADEEPEALGLVAKVHQEVAGLLVVQDPSGWAVTPRMCRWRSRTSRANRT